MEVGERCWREVSGWIHVNITSSFIMILCSYASLLEDTPAIRTPLY